MKTMTLARAAALVALLAALPAPASAQFGFIKKQLKQKIAHAVVDSALSRLGESPLDSTDDGAGKAPAKGKAPGTSAAGSTSAPAGRNAPAAAGPHFDDYVIEITPLSLDRLEKYLVALKTDGNAEATGAKARATQTDPLGTVQLGLMTQRVMAFCAAAAPQGKGGAVVSALSASNGLYNAYKPSEMAVLRPRCGKLMPLIGDESQ